MDAGNIEKLTYALLMKLMRQEFSHKPERQIVEAKSNGCGFQITCPWCGGSTHHAHHLKCDVDITGKFAGLVKCHKCQRSSSLSGLFREYKIDMPPDFESEMKRNYVALIKSRGKRTFQKGCDMADATKIIDYTVPIRDFARASHLQFASESPEASAYLRGRMINCLDRFLYSYEKKQIFVLNTVGDRLISYQKRSLGVSGSRYLTVTLSKLNEIMRTGKEVPQEFNDAASLYNLFNVRFSEPVFCTEGAMDALCIGNCVALGGASKHLPVDIDVNYVFDNDKAGRKEAVRRLEIGMKVLDWGRLHIDYGFPLRDKWDVNDIIIWCAQNNREIPDWTKYMTDDMLDFISVSTGYFL